MKNVRPAQPKRTKELNKKMHNECVSFEKKILLVIFISVVAMMLISSFF